MIRAQQEWLVRKRDGRVVPFDMGLIERAIANAFRAELNLADAQPLDPDLEAEIKAMAADAAQEVADAASTERGAEVEKIQDVVELLLMKRGHFRVGRRYIVYRAEHAKMRALRGEVEIGEEEPQQPVIHVTWEDGIRVPFDQDRVRARLFEACKGL